MIRLFTLVITSFLLVLGCGGRKATVSSINPADTTNFFFSGILNVDNKLFTDCATAKIYKYDLGVQNSRAISSKVNNTLQVGVNELYCKVKGRIIYDAPKKINVLIIEDALLLSRLHSCDKPLLPNKYLSGNTFRRSYALTLNDDYTYTLELDGKEIESGIWGKNFEYQGLMVWHKVTEDNQNVRTFTIDYLANSIIVSMMYNDQYLIFS